MLNFGGVGNIYLHLTVESVESVAIVHLSCMVNISLTCRIWGMDDEVFSEKMDDGVFLGSGWWGLYKTLEGNIYLVCKRCRMIILTIYHLLQETYPLTE